MSDRFSKTNLIAALQRRADALEKKRGFDRNNGTAQLQDELATMDVAVDYGEYRLALNMIQQIEDGSFYRM
jgi:hypothetical protein